MFSAVAGCPERNVPLVTCRHTEVTQFTCAWAGMPKQGGSGNAIHLARAPVLTARYYEHLAQPHAGFGIWLGVAPLIANDRLLGTRKMHSRPEANAK